MAFAPQGTFKFPGINNVLSGNFSLTTGVSPSVCILSVAPQPLWTPKVGTLAVDYSNVHLRFRNCTIDRVESRTDTSGVTTWSVAILDRRWKWRGLGRISGYYNVRRETISDHPLEIIDGTEKSPRDLAKLCFQALDETGYDLSRMPNQSRPSIDWDYMTPAEALARLCEEVDCLVTLTADDRIVICRKNIGQALPYTPTVLSGGSEVDPPERPDSIVVVTGPTRIQQDLLLVAVGDDVDHEVKLLDDLSYRPRGGWSRTDLYGAEFLEVTNPGHRKLAAKSVFRKYRVHVPFTLVDGEEIEDLDRILPLLNTQVWQQTIQGRREPRPIEIFGRFYSDEFASLKDESAEGESLLPGVIPPNRPYTDSFSVDARTGIVTFSQPVYRYFLGPDGFPDIVTNALLYLRIGFNIRDAKTRGWRREEYETRTEGPRSETPPAYFRHDDLVPKLWNTKSGQRGDNRIKIRRQAENYRDGHLGNYLVLQPQTYEYAGFVKLSPDGAVSNVTWTLSGEGFATSRAVRGKDDLLATPTYSERRLWERLAEDHRQEAKTEAERAQRLRQGQA